MKKENKKIYTVICFWVAEDEEPNCEIIGNYLSLESAKKALKKRRKKELKITKELGHTIFEDTELIFDEGLEGYYNTNFCTIKIEETKLCE